MDSIFKNENTTFVFDRCTPDTTVNYKLNTNGTGFLAGYCRDLGAENIDDDILFLDGDKVPKGDIIKDINNLKNKYDAIFYGIDGNLEDSRNRDFMKEDNKDDLMPWISNKSPFAYGCYSCGVWLSKEAINALRKINNGRIFHSDFDGIWGDEDNFLADELYYLGFKLGYSTHVRLYGTFSEFEGREKINGYFDNFMKRSQLRKTLFNTVI